MMRYRVMLFMAVVLLLSLGAGYGQAQTSSTPSGGAMLYANGNARVNGQPAGISTSIFAGDRVDVGDASSVSINRSGSSIVLSPNSSVLYSPADVDVLKGTARVSTNQGMSVRVGSVSVSPADRSQLTKFDVVANAGNVNIASQEGALTVDDKGRAVAVSAGSNTTLAVVGAAAAQQSTVAEANFATERLAEHPFYGVLNGVSTAPVTLPVCASVSICLRPNVSQIHPCCCPPIVLCNH